MDFEIYDGMKLRDLCSMIVKNQQSKKDQLDIMTAELRTLIKTPNDAPTVAPVVQGMVEAGIRNDEILSKLAAVIQRLISAKTMSGGTDGNAFFTEDDRKQLLSEVRSDISNLKSESVSPIKVVDIGP